MFIRKTQVQKKRVGGHYYTYRIESLRTGKEVRRQILLNLGADFSLPEEKWPILTKRIQEILHGQLSIFDIDCKIDKLARNFAAKIIIKQQDKNESIVDYREVDINSLEMSRPRSVGCEHVTLEALRSLGLDTKPAELGFTRPQVALAIHRDHSRACLPSCRRT